MGQIHFCDVGCADCTVLQSGSDTFLLDCAGIENHVEKLPASRRLLGVFVSHQHRDHFGGLRFLRDSGYSIQYLIYSPYYRRYNDQSVEYDEWQEFNDLRDAFVGNGTETRTPCRQQSFDEPFWTRNGVSFWIIAPFEDLATSDTRELHDACLVVKVIAGERHFLVCGDASDASVSRVAANTNNYCDDVLRCSHHGSLEGSDLDFIRGAGAEFTVISTRAGVHQNVPHPTALRRYEENTQQGVYRTDKDGTVQFAF